MAEKIKCDCGNTFEVEKEQTHCKYCGIKLSDIGKEKLVGLEEEDKTTLSESQKKKIEEEEEYRLSVKRDLGKKKKGKGCLIAIGLLIGFFILVAASGDNEEKVKSKPAPTPVKQEEAKINSKPIIEEDAGFTEYYQKFRPISTRVAEYLTRRGEIAGKWPNWTNEDVIEFAATGVGLELAYDEAKELTPPIILASVHQKWLKALSLFKQSVPIANKGIDNLNADLISQSADLMQQGGELMTEATKELEKVTEKLKQ